MSWLASMERTIRVGTRASPLALAQTKIVTDLLRKQKEGANFNFETIKIRTEGDVNGTKTATSSTSSGKDSFTRAIDVALESCEIDIAVHSLKDLPADPLYGLEIAAFPKRESPYDVLIPRIKGQTLGSLPGSAKIGTSSRRRAVQLRAARPDVEIVEIYGNVQSRIEKLRKEEEDLDAIVLARAGLNRLGFADFGSVLPKEIVLPAPGQGCLAVVVRKNDPQMRSIVSMIDDADTRSAVLAERSFSRELGGGCNTPIAALATVAKNKLILEGMVESPKSDSLVARSRMEGKRDEAETLGKQLAVQLSGFIEERR